MKAFLQLPRTLRNYVGLVILAGMSSFAWELAHAPLSGSWLLQTLAMVLLAMGFNTVRVRLIYSSQWLTFDIFIICLSQLLLGTPTAMICAGVGAAVTSRYFLPASRFRLVRSAMPGYRVLFNMGACGFSAAVAGYACEGTRQAASFLGPEAVVLAVLAWGLTYYLFNTFIVTSAIALFESQPILAWWKKHGLWTWPGYLASAALAGMLVTLWERFQFFALLPIPLIYFVYASFQAKCARTELKDAHQAELGRMIESLMTSLAMAIEAKDAYTREHIQRVHYFAVSLAEAAGLEPTDQEAVRLASLVYDVGKIAIPEQILSKPGKLTPEEFQRVKEHVTTGAMILEPVGFTCPVVDAVRSHHERWDGLGYPDGLRGEAIPVAARVVAVADLFDALTSNRPYRSAFTPEVALAMVREAAGTQLDPRLAETFVRIYPEVSRRMPQLGLPAADAARQPANLPDAVYTHMAAATAGEMAAAFDLMEALILDQGANAYERTLEHLWKVLPSATAAIYLPHGGRGEWVAAMVRGAYADRLQGMSIRMGEGVSGRAARDQRSFINASALPDVARILAPSEHLELTSVLCAPVVVRNETVAVITLYHTAYEAYRERHLHVLTTVAGHLAAALEQRKQSAANREPELVDPETGLYNLRHLMATLGARVNQPEAQAAPLALLLVDLAQQFSEADAPLGDAMIHAVARALRQFTEAGAVVYRCARAEFVIVLDGKGRDEAELLANEVRTAIGSAGRKSDRRPTCSVGIAQFPEDGATVKALVAAADLRMYHDRARK